MINKIFIFRYIKQNAYNRAQKLGIRVQPEHSFVKRLYSKIILRFFVVQEFFIYLSWKKIIIPQIQLVLTTKCTLRCKNCSNLMPYFDKENHFTSSYKEIQTNINKLTESIDEISILYVLGGEPLMIKNLEDILEFLLSNKKIKQINVVTNSTILINEKIFNVAKDNRDKIFFSISDYSKNPEIQHKILLRQNIQILQENRISYEIFTSDIEGFFGWKDYGRVYPRNRTKEENIKNFINCKTPCVSMIGSTIHVCPVSSSLYQILAKKEYPKKELDTNDYIDLNDYHFPSELRQRIISFYSQSYFSCCDYCQDMSIEAKSIPPAIQTKDTLTIP